MKTLAAALLALLSAMSLGWSMGPFNANAAAASTTPGNDTVGTEEIINSTIALVDLNTTSVDTRYLTTGTMQTINAVKTFSAGIDIGGNDITTAGDVQSLKFTQTGVSSISTFVGPLTISSNTTFSAAIFGSNILGTTQIIDSTVALVDLNTGDVDTRYLTTGTAQTVSGAKTFTGTQTFNGNISSTGTVTATKVFSSTRSSIVCYNGNGFASTDTKIRRYSTCTEIGTDVTMSSTAANGQTFTVNSDGFYAVHVMDYSSSGGIRAGVSVNGTALTTNIDAISVAQGWIGVMGHSTTPAYKAMDGTTLFLSAGDVVRSHGDGVADATDVLSFFRIERIY